MQQNTYRPVINISVLPTEDQDSFLASGGKLVAQFQSFYIVALIMTFLL